MMCVFVGNIGSVIANTEMFPVTVELVDYGLYINGICVYEDEELNEAYSNLMQLLTVTLKEEYPTDEVQVFQVGV